MFDRQSPLRIDPPSADAAVLWAKALEVAHALGESEDWTLVGGLMVQLHALEHDRDTRLTTDIDVLGNARRRPQMTKRIAEERAAVAMRRPSLLGAILIKARALAKRRRNKFESDRQGLVGLLSLVDDPRDLAATGELKAAEQRWLTDVAEALNFNDPSLADLFDREQLVRAQQAFDLLLASD